MKQKEDILLINVLRFFAALGVLSYHSFSQLITNNYIPNAFSFLSQFAKYGNLGVDLFFIISGFVISLSSEGRTFFQFISARFIRLFPVFWLCVSITSLFVLLSNSADYISWQKYLSNLTMLPSIFGGYEYIDVSYWTLRVELKFYLIIAIILLLRKFVNLSLQKIAVVLSSLLLYYTLFCNLYYCPSAFKLFFWSYGEEYLQYFVAGILFYEIYKNNKNYYNYIALLMCYFVALIKTNNHDHINIGINIIYITIFFLIFLAISLKKITNNFFNKKYKNAIIVLGAVTYPLYLLHDKIIHITIKILNEYTISPYIGMTILLSVIILLLLLVNKFDYYIHNLWKKYNNVKI